jgi:hypothetical protein
MIHESVCLKGRNESSVELAAGKKRTAPALAIDAGIRIKRKQILESVLWTVEA